MDEQHELLIGNIAQDYYYDKMPISYLTEKYNLSRYLILKYLDEGITHGIVQININSGFRRNAELEQRLKKKFSIRHIYVLKDPKDPAKREDNIGNFSALQIQTLIKKCHVVGVAWGETVYNVISHMQQSERSDLVFNQFIGEEMKYNSSFGSMRMVQLAAAKYDAPYYVLPGPSYIVNDKIRKALRNEPSMKKAMDVMTKMDMIICGVGTLASIDSVQPWRDYKADIFPNVDLNKIVGMVYGRPFDIDGDFLVDSRNDKTLAAPLKTLLKVPNRFCIVLRRSKYRAALGALRGGFFTDLVLSEANALRIANIVKA